MGRSVVAVVGLGLAWFVLGGCGDDDGGGPRERPDLTGAICDVPEDCYPDVDPTMLSGEVRCLTRVRAGYCTHLCEVDTDCCAAEGECRTNLSQVCSPFESTGERLCFLSCESSALPVVEGRPEDDQVYCQREAGPDFICRSSGGGSANRKVCVPGDCGIGAACDDAADCDADLTCVRDLDGGYCTVPGCSASNPCPNGSVCADSAAGPVCLKTCMRETDCSFCRGSERPAVCRSDVTLLDATTASVCVPGR